MWITARHLHAVLMYNFEPCIRPLDRVVCCAWQAVKWPLLPRTPEALSENGRV